MENLKQQLQNIWENLAFQSKIFFKSHDIAIITQILLLSLPLILTLFSFYLSWCEWSNLSRTLDYFAFWTSIIALVYYTYFWKNSELYKSWWEKYLVIYKEVENYFKTNKESYKKEDIENFIKKQNKIWVDLNKPNIHLLSKKLVDRTIEKEMKYWNEDVVWWKS